MQRVGLYIGTQFPPGVDVAAALKDMSEQVRVARRSGFSSLWVPHHYLTHPMQMLAPIPMLSYLLRDAEGMTIGTNILIMPLLNPVHVAEDAVTLDLLSGGRYVLGIGVGYRDAEFQTFNVPLKERAQRMDESIEIMRRLWTEDKITHAGKSFPDSRSRYRSQAAAQGRPADMARRSGGCGRAACGTAWRCVADHQLRSFERAGAANGHVSEAADRGEERGSPRTRQLRANAISDRRTPKRSRNAKPRFNTNMALTRPGGSTSSRRERSRLSNPSRSSPKIASSSATKRS